MMAATLATGLLLGGCATAQQSDSAQLEQALTRMMAGQSQMQGAALDRAIAAAAAYPLGSRENPVRAAMPAGQRAYLARLRCADGQAPAYSRNGNLGGGVYGNIIDAYAVTCAGKDAVTVIMDMYHNGYVEDRPVPGFTIAGR